jgi:hypothetical protein
MKKATLIRGTSQESAQASQVLRNSSIEFREILSSSSHHTPSLIVPDHAFAYKGLNSIKEYVTSKSIACDNIKTH